MRRDDVGESGEGTRPLYTQREGFGRSAGSAARCPCGQAVKGSNPTRQLTNNKIDWHETENPGPEILGIGQAGGEALLAKRTVGKHALSVMPVGSRKGAWSYERSINQSPTPVASSTPSGDHYHGTVDSSQSRRRTLTKTPHRPSI